MFTKVVSMNDGHKIFVRIYEPTRKPIGYFHILHGMAEHSGRYEEFSKLLCNIGYIVVAHDHRGHGKTAELNNSPLGFIAEHNGFERIVEDVHEVIEQVKVEKNLPTILFGHSMGSFVTRRYIQLYSDEIDKVILCGTGATTLLHITGNILARSFSKIKGKQKEGKLFSELSFGSFNKKIPNAKTFFDWLSRDDEIVEKYLEDPYCGFIPTNQFFVDLTNGLKTIVRKKEIDKIRKDLPILLISGSDDPVGNNGKGVFQVANQYEQCGLTNITIHLFEGMRHEILNEINNEKVYEVILRWLGHK